MPFFKRGNPVAIDPDQSIEVGQEELDQLRDDSAVRLMRSGCCNGCAYGSHCLGAVPNCNCCDGK